VREVEKASGSVNEGKGKGNEAIGAAGDETVEEELHGDSGRGALLRFPRIDDTQQI
jgi:hypothetical protein